ncbi:MAG: histidine phosphatase family protein [Mariprofundales bacterium]|nr:histidine phosphatase family protein [Mariprofundales bacterium]
MSLADNATYVAFLRHGEYCHRAQTPGAMQPFALTDLGRKQAEEGAQALALFADAHGVAIAPAIHTSVVLRGWQSAEIIRQQLEKAMPARSSETGYHLVETAALTERRVGCLANLTVEEIEQVVGDDPRYDAPPAGWKSDSHYRLPYPGAESLLEAGGRVATYLQQTMRHAADGVHVFVGHGAAFRHAAYHLGVLELAQVATISIYHAQPMIFALDADRHWHHIAGAWKLRSRTSASAYID